TVRVSIWVYMISLFTLYLSSSLYHYVSTDSWKLWLQKLDHCAIYVKIAGTYTPFLLLLGSIAFRHELLIAIWLMVVLGIVLKMIFTGRFNIFFTILYLAMGWVAVFLFKTLYASLSSMAFSFLIGGGVCFSVGVIFYLSKKIPFNHAIWHLFVLAGSIFHYFSIMDLVRSI
ncbi:MAG: hemolysin III family protein, partial [Fulvivirga sp.]|uniref:PAQR family membrane homeostasis protein TrhA n=1 Tax=Fulvivirga sp. TaxID=1931237 RepID=UPI0032EC7B38